MKWAYLKFQIRKFTISYCKICAKIIEKKNEKELKDVEKYNKIKPKLEEIYEKFVEGAKVRSKCTWYEEGKGTHNSF